MGFNIQGTGGEDNLIGVADGTGQIHMWGEQGDDVLRMGFGQTIQTPNGNNNEVNGHHVYGDHGSDEFRFENTGNVTSNGVRVVGRIDDYNPGHDKIFVNGTEIDLENPPSNVRIVEHQGQQWILINGNILYALEGARYDPSEPTLEERHFIDWPQAWLNGVPSSADVAYDNPFNFVPASHYDSLNLPLIYSRLQTLNGTDNAEHIYSDKWRTQTEVFTHQVIDAKGGNDVVDANHGNDTVYGRAGNDSLSGGLDDDLIQGGSGNDHIWGGTGNDTLKGETGADKMYGGRGNDNMSGADGNDSLYGGDGADVIFGRNDHDLIEGGGGGDSIQGDSGNDTIDGDGGNDTVRGGDGHDSLRGSGGNDTIYGDNGQDTLKGENGNDHLIAGNGNDNLSGADGNDTLDGNAGNDTIYGRNDDDLIRGGGGNDRLQGDAGNDTLIGDSGADAFVFQDGHGDDKIRDFDPNQAGEVINIRTISAISNFTDLMNNHATQSGNHVLIDTGGGNSIRIDHVLLSELSANDFLF